MVLKLRPFNINSKARWFDLTNYFHVFDGLEIRSANGMWVAQVTAHPIISMSILIVEM